MTKMPAMLDQKQLDKLSTTYDADYKKMVEEQGKLKNTKLKLLQ
jgi:outer membrane protein